MELRKNLWVSTKKDKSVWSNFSGTWIEETELDKMNVCLACKSYCSSSKNSDEDKQNYIDKCLAMYKNLMTEEQKRSIAISEDFIQDTCKKLIDFFKDMEFEPNFRFVNTLAKHAMNVENAQQYIWNYFNVSDNGMKEDAKEKVKSKEFIQIAEDLAKIKCKKRINNRFKLYYGSQGTGKTTKAIEEANGKVIACHSAMLPSDLLEDFKFEDGKATFKKSAMWEAMEKGEAICLDEINLLPFESLRFLQSILDDKKSIIYKNQTIEIKDGFKIIGTMNLTVNGTSYGLPEPLVDRAEDIQEFRLTASQLIGALA